VNSALVVPAGIHAVLRAHLFPGDGKEAAAILLCAASPGRRIRLLAREVIPIPHEACPVREADRITWPGIWIEEAISRGEADGLRIVLIHSHPGGFFGFSAVDDESDAVVIPALFAAYHALHGTAVMTPDGAIMGRFWAKAARRGSQTCTVASTTCIPEALRSETEACTIRSG